MQKKKTRLVAITATALLTALAVVIGRFLSINLWNMSIGFAFVPLMLCGFLFGPLWGGVCGGLADFLGATLFPFGVYFPGFTATAFLSGILFGLCGRIYNKSKSFWPFFLLSALIIIIKEAVCSLLLNSYWISLLYGSPFDGVLISRIPLSAVMTALEIAFSATLYLFILPPIKREMERF